jgi:hypothetical protein
MDNRIDALLGEERVGSGGWTGAFIKIVEKFVYGLAIVVLYIPETLDRVEDTMVEAISLPSIGILSKKLRGRSASSSSL